MDAAGAEVDSAKSAQVRAEGNAAFKKGRWQQSIDLYTKAAELDPQNPTALCNRAQAYLRLEKFSEAERDCTKALGLGKANLKALYRRSLARRGLNRITEAIDDLNELLELEPDNQQALSELEDLQSHSRLTAPPGNSIVTFADLRKERQAKKATFAVATHPISASTSIGQRDHAETSVRSTFPTPTNLPAPPQNPSSTESGAGVQLLRRLAEMDPSAGWRYLNYYSPESIPIILRDLLDPESLGRIFLCLEQGSEEPSRVKTIMEGLRTMPRYHMNAMMLSVVERSAAQRAWQSSGGEGMWV